MKRSALTSIVAKPHFIAEGYFISVASSCAKRASFAPNKKSSDHALLFLFGAEDVAREENSPVDCF